MRNRLTRGRAVIGGATLVIAIAAVAAVASVAYACVGFPQETKFDVKNAAGTADAPSGTTGDSLRAVGTGIEYSNHPYRIYVLAEPWVNTPAERNDCGSRGSLQTTATTSQINPSRPLTEKFNGKFDQPFTLRYDPTSLGRGPHSAHFCALPGLPEPNSGAVLGQLEGPYIYQPFSLTIL